MKTQQRRRKQHKTDYGKRIKLLKSEKPRIVFRRTNKYIIAQYVESHEAKDKVIIGITSKNLLEFGWPEKNKGSLKSIPASYLTGYLIGKEIISKKLEMPIVDFGMLRTPHKTKPHAFLKGLVDAGIKIKTQEKTFPEEERIMGESLKEKIDVMKIKTEIDKK
ncbi:MAG: 50S ribosomal protein L18 [Candidatus Pacearchaeota archaeon]|jgi:large subunit ribosomal protein L18